MAVRAERIEGDDDVRADAAYVTGDRLARLGRIDAVELAVEIVEHDHLAHAELVCRRAQLGLARAPDDVGPGPGSLVVESPALAARGGHHERLDPFARILRENPARPERLIVGMGEHAHQPQFHAMNSNDRSKKTLRLPRRSPRPQDVADLKVSTTYHQPTSYHLPATLG